MGVPISEVGYTPAMPRREDHEVHKGYVVALDQKKKVPKTERDWDCVMVVGCFTDVTEYDRATPATSNAVAAAWGAVILSFHGVANLHKW